MTVYLLVGLSLTHSLQDRLRCFDGPSQMFITSHLISEISPRGEERDDTANLGSRHPHAYG